MTLKLNIHHLQLFSVLALVVLLLNSLNMRALCQSAVLLSVVFVSWFLSASAGNSDCSKKVSACSCKGSKISIDLSEVLAPFQNG